MQIFRWTCQEKRIGESDAALPDQLVPKVAIESPDRDVHQNKMPVSNMPRLCDVPLKFGPIPEPADTPEAAT